MNALLEELNQSNQLTPQKLLKYGLHVTVNSDDPAYFGGYLNENYEALVESLGMNEDELRKLVKNSFDASFLTEIKK